MNSWFIRTLAFCAVALTSYSVQAEEKTLTVYTYDSFNSEWGPGPLLKADFEKKCGCALEFVSTDDAVSILNRIRLEKEKSQADVILGLDNNLMAQAAALDLLAEHNTDLSALALPNQWNSSIFVPFDYSHFAFIYNSDKVKTVPTSFADLLESDLSIIYQDPRTSSPGLGMLLWIKSLYGEEFSATFAKIAKQTVTVTANWTDAYNMFLAGESDVVLSYTTSPVYHQIAEQDTKYKALSFSEGLYQQIEVAARLKSSKQPELAQQFLTYLLSDDAQLIIATNNWMLPVTNISKQLPAEFAAIKAPAVTLQIDSAEIAKQRQLWTTQWIEAVSQ